MIAAGYKGEVRFEGPIKGDNIGTWFNQNEFISSKKAKDRLGWTSKHGGVIKIPPIGAYASRGKRRRCLRREPDWRGAGGMDRHLEHCGSGGFS